MRSFLEGFTVFLVAVAMAFALAHAAELPGKMRLPKDTYLAVQPIYYPGFTVGAISEPAAIVATLALFVVTWLDGAASGWVLGAFLALVAMHGVYWVVTHPVNGFWLKDQSLKGVSEGFFSFGVNRDRAANPERAEDWKQLRNRWEYSHVVRAGLSMLSLILLLIAVSM